MLRNSDAIERIGLMLFELKRGSGFEAEPVRNVSIQTCTTTSYKLVNEPQRKYNEEKVKGVALKNLFS